MSIAVLPILREAFSQRPEWRAFSQRPEWRAFSQRPEWRAFSQRQLSILMVLHGYTSEPVEEFDIAVALPFALEDWEGAA